MKITLLRKAALACAAFVLLSALNQASADPFITFHIGPLPHEEHHDDYGRWQDPGDGAVWIPGHREWENGQWVWVGGHYEYPPRRGMHWVPGHYSDRTGEWRPGHWDY